MWTASRTGEAEELGVRARVSWKVSPIGNLFERPVRKYFLREFHLLPNDEYLHSTSSSRDNDVQRMLASFPPLDHAYGP